MSLSKHFGAAVLSIVTALALSSCGNEPVVADLSSSPESTAEGEATVASDAEVTITDVDGRTLTFDGLPDRIVLGKGRYMLAASTLQSNPFDQIVAYGQDLIKTSASLRDKLLEAFPEGEDIPTIGAITKGDVTVESLLAQNPDVVVLSIEQKKPAEESGFLADLDATGIPYAFIDFRLDPLENTPISMEVLGELLGERERAQKFNQFYNDKVKTVTERVGESEERPEVLMWTAAGYDECCTISGDIHLATLIPHAGGTNLGPSVVSLDNPKITPEKLIELNPEHLIVTGGEWAPDPNNPETYRHVEMGYQSSPELALETAYGPLMTSGLELLDAPKNGKYYAVYHQFTHSPLNVFVLEAYAKWLHPDKFEDMDPVEDFQRFHEEWIPFEYSGAFLLHPADSDGASKPDDNR